MFSMYISLCCRGETRVNVAVDEKRWKVASLMKCGPVLLPSSSSSSPSSSLSSRGIDSLGVGISILYLDRVFPSLGWVGIVPL